MNSYHQYIHSARRSVAPPKSLVNEKGECVFGTFTKEFEQFNLLKAKKPTRLPQFLNRYKLTLWQAAEIHLPQGVLVCGIADMGVIGKIYNVFYHKATNKVYGWDTNLTSGRVEIAPNLLRGSRAFAQTKKASIEFINHFDQGTCTFGGHNHNGQQGIEYAFELTRLSKPSVVSIPFGQNRPLYSQKDFLKARGYLIFNGEKMEADAFTTAIVDDHRGYYPRHAHYDWLSSMGHYDIGGKKQYFAFNLTRNQSINQQKHNENLIWFEERISLLPPVTFTQSIKCIDYQGSAFWIVKDDHDMVNLTFHIKDISPMVLHTPLVSIDYFFAFGTLEGYLRDEEGKQYFLDGCMAMGEDKSLVL